MKKKRKTQPVPPTQCSMDALITLDSRGQLVLPKDLRVKAGLKAGDKLAAVACEDNGDVCCIMLIKADTVAQVIKGMLGPTVAQILGG